MLVSKATGLIASACINAKDTKEYIALESINIRAIKLETQKLLVINVWSFSSSSLVIAYTYA